MIIYKATNKITGLSYIGQTRMRLKARWSNHVNSKKIFCRLLRDAIDRYGQHAFELTILAHAESLEELDALEAYYIALENTVHPNGYNLQRGQIDRKHHEETKTRMSASRTGKAVPALQRPRGPCPLQTRMNISAAKKGKSNGLTGTKREYKPCPTRFKGVVAYDGETSIAFSSIKKASEFLKKNHSNIVACLKGRKGSAYGFTWSYLENKQETK